MKGVEVVFQNAWTLVLGKGLQKHNKWEYLAVGIPPNRAKQFDSFSDANLTLISVLAWSCLGLNIILLSWSDFDVTLIFYEDEN